MFRSRKILAALVVLAILPLVGCANRRSSNCNYAPRPVVAAAPCSSCPNASGPPPIVLGQ